MLMVSMFVTLVIVVLSVTLFVTMMLTQEEIPTLRRREVFTRSAVKSVEKPADYDISEEYDEWLFENARDGTVKESLPNHNQEDPELVKELLSRMIPPSPREQLILRQDDFDTSQGQASVVRKLTNFMTDGFFVECGAGNGEFYSNTLFLEKHLNWTGLLVEGDPDNARLAQSMRRHVWLAPVCMSLNTSAHDAMFQRVSGFLGRVASPDDWGQKFQTRCYPFYTFMLALNVTRVDYFSLDVEGHEVEILETVPFDQVDITIFSVEYSKSRGGRRGVMKTMNRFGYRKVMEVPPDDLMFVKITSNLSL